VILLAVRPARNILHCAAAGVCNRRSEVRDCVFFCGG
jgi:hypothetical protein